MALTDYVHRMNRIDRLIRMKATGKPQELASRVGVSERSLYEDIQQLKIDFGCPIAYSRSKQSYYYKKDGQIAFGFNKVNTDANIDNNEL